MAKKLFVGNLPYSITDHELEGLFQPHGSVQSAQVVVDRVTGRSKGFGFVEMDSAENAQAAITTLNGHELNGRPLTVTESKPREGADTARYAEARGGSRRP